jgi:hypothetical protein
MTVPTFVDVIDAMKIMARKIDDLEKRLTALEAAPVMRIHHNGPAKMLLPDEPAPAAADPDAPVLCPNCGAPVRCENCDKMMDWVGPAAAIVRRMRGTR